MSGPFAKEFWKAAVKEYHTFKGMDAWVIVDQPLHAKILDIIWAFKIKQFSDGLIKGFKGRICARGDQLGNTILVKLELWELVIVLINNFYSATNLCLSYALAKCGR
jgi:hypothetical protein